ncbi:hypothetical protein TI03_07530, partial [Achromatium sp. WMS1]
MEKAKEAIIAYIGDPTNLRQLEPTPNLFHRVVGALQVIKHKIAADVLDKIRKFIKQYILTRSLIPDQSLLEALAESISGIEYYMEAVVDNRTDTSNILNITTEALQRLLTYGDIEDSQFFPSSTLDSSQLLQNEDTVAQETVQRDENEQKVLEQEL